MTRLEKNGNCTQKFLMDEFSINRYGKTLGCRKTRKTEISENWMSFPGFVSDQKSQNNENLITFLLENPKLGNFSKFYFLNLLKFL